MCRTGSQCSCLKGHTVATDSLLVGRLCSWCSWLGSQVVTTAGMLVGRISPQHNWLRGPATTAVGVLLGIAGSLLIRAGVTWKEHHS